MSPEWALRLRREGCSVGDLAFLLRPYDLTESLIARLISGDLRDLLDNSTNAEAARPVRITRPMNPLTQAAQAWYEDRLRGFI